jgi:hypothetical protein
MKRLLLGVALAASAAVVLGPAASGAANGVSPGTPVTVRANPSNAIVDATRQAAGNVGLGGVEAVGFHPDCSPTTGRVIVCRNPQLHKNGARAVTLIGPNWCVVRTDPSVGGAGHGVSVMTKALAKCLSS